MVWLLISSNVMFCFAGLLMIGASLMDNDAKALIGSAWFAFITGASAYALYTTNIA